jgi:hypothetical protein
MRIRYGAPVLAAALLLTACGVGDGLRVEGTAAPATSSATPKPGWTVKTTPKIGMAETVQPLSVKTLRKVLLSDDRVDDDIQDVVRACVWGCVKPGPMLAKSNGGLPLQVVSVTTADGSVFVVYVIDDLTTEPRVEWHLEGDYMRVSVGKGPVLVVESSVFGPDDRACCPSGSKVGVYHWNGRKMAQLSELYR